MNEHQLGKRVRQILNSAPLGSGVEHRLQRARELALSHQRPEGAAVFAWAGNLRSRFGGRTATALYALASLALIAAAAGGFYSWQQNQRIAEVEEIDSQLLTDDLPIDAYLDRGFQNWLKRRSPEQ